MRAESGKRLMQHYLDVTDPDLVVVEMDIYWAHVAQHQHRWRYDENGARVEDIFDPLATVAKQTHRYPLYHAKDGDRTAEPLGVGNGYTMVPFGDPTADIDYADVLQGAGRQGVAQPELRAGQRARRQRGRPRSVAALHRDQCGQHERAPRLAPMSPRSGARAPWCGRRFGHAAVKNTLTHRMSSIYG